MIKDTITSENANLQVYTIDAVTVRVGLHNGEYNETEMTVFELREWCKRVLLETEDP